MCPENAIYSAQGSGSTAPRIGTLTTTEYSPVTRIRPPTEHPMFDYLIKNATLVDGLGGAPKAAILPSKMA